MLIAILVFGCLGGLAYAVYLYSKRQTEAEDRREERRREDIEPTISNPEKEFVDRASGRNRDTLDDVE